jgi:hypothetical protein
MEHIPHRIAWVPSPALKKKKRKESRNIKRYQVFQGWILSKHQQQINFLNMWSQTSLKLLFGMFTYKHTKPLHYKQITAASVIFKIQDFYFMGHSVTHKIKFYHKVILA